jgi:hypothetical protein
MVLNFLMQLALPVLNVLLAQVRVRLMTIVKLADTVFLHMTRPRIQYLVAMVREWTRKITVRNLNVCPEY